MLGPSSLCSEQQRESCGFLPRAGALRWVHPPTRARAAAARQDPAAVPRAPHPGQPAHHHVRPGAGPRVGWVRALCSQLAAVSGSDGWAARRGHVWSGSRHGHANDLWSLVLELGGSQRVLAAGGGEGSGVHAAEGQQLSTRGGALRVRCGAAHQHPVSAAWRRSAPRL